jgi:hypothetical protein
MQAGKTGKTDRKNFLRKKFDKMIDALKRLRYNKYTMSIRMVSSECNRSR